jgi:hypothetical protein
MINVQKIFAVVLFGFSPPLLSAGTVFLPLYRIESACSPTLASEGGGLEWTKSNDCKKSLVFPPFLLNAEPLFKPSCEIHLRNIQTFSSRPYRNVLSLNTFILRRQPERGFHIIRVAITGFCLRDLGKIYEQPLQRLANVSW